jgi:hypothetical protein
MNAPQVWIVLLRIVLGAWFLKAVWTKLTIASVWGIPYPAVSPRFIGFQLKRVTEFTAEQSRAVSRCMQIGRRVSRHLDRAAIQTGA